ncbi:MAG: hypothetical protein DHS80DRAFT_20776, partial [Piptocephalis tieghemiana]
MIPSLPNIPIQNTPSTDPTGQYRIAGLKDLLLSGHADRASLSLGTGLSIDLGPGPSPLDHYLAPWLEPSPTPLDPPRYQLPPSYTAIRPPPPAQHKMGSFSDSTLFYIFYVMTGDVLQEAAAQELYNRDWRYNKAEGYWLTRAPKTFTHERGQFLVFSVSLWRPILQDITFAYADLEERPS